MSDKQMHPVMQWIDYRLPIFTFLNHELHEYPTPKNLNYWWNFGSLAGIILVIMLVTGIVLAMHYTAHVDLAFGSVERIMRDVNYGWLIRYVHMNGASMFFIIEVRRYSLTESSTTLYWSESTPMAQTFEPESSVWDFVASKTPNPVPPAAW